MHKYAFAFVAITILNSPSSLKACDDDSIYNQVPPGVFHFKDGRSPTAPVPCDHGTGDTEGYTPYFQYGDYGPARVPAPEPMHPSQSTKHPSPGS